MNRSINHLPLSIPLAITANVLVYFTSSSVSGKELIAARSNEVFMVDTTVTQSGIPHILWPSSSEDTTDPPDDTRHQLNHSDESKPVANGI